MESTLPEEVNQMMKDSGKQDSHKSVITLLNTVKRPGIDKLITYLESSDFFIAPASTRFHGCYAGGLVDHSLSVYNKLAYFCTHYGLLKPDTSMGKKPLPLKPENIVIAALLHDVNKIGKYASKDDGGYKLNKGNLTSHAKLSIQRASEFIKLDPIEDLMIRYHMGIHYSIEMDPKKGEYPLRGDRIACEGMSKEESQKARYGKSLRNAYYHNPIVEFFAMADVLATQAEKIREQK